MNYSTYRISRKGIFKKKYGIYNEQGQVYYAQSSAFVKGATMWDGAGNVVFKFKRPFTWFKLTFEIYQEGSLIASIIRRQKLFKHNLEVEAANGNYLIEAKAFLKEFTIFKNGHEIAKVSRKPFSPKKLYGIAIEGDQDDELIIAMVIVMEMILRIQKSRRSS